MDNKGGGIGKLFDLVKRDLRDDCYLEKQENMGDGTD